MVETGLGYPLVIKMSEDEFGRGTIASLIDELTQTRPSLRLINPPEWLAVSGQNTPDLTLLAQFESSPFCYEVESVDDRHQHHITYDFNDVPCSQNTCCYIRLDAGYVRIPLTVQKVGDIQTVECFVEVSANYSIGKTALQGVIQCQP